MFSVIKNISISKKLFISHGLILLAFLVVSVLMFWTTEQQKDDGAIINLAGRQRMLTQKMSKEVLLFTKGDIKKEAVQKTMTIFKRTLKALTDGGNAPTSLTDLKKVRLLPPMTVPDTKKQLEKVNTLWLTFESNINSILSNKDNIKALNYIKNNNVILLKNMNKAVGKMQKTAEVKVFNLKLITIIGFIFALVIFLLAYLISRSISSAIVVAMSFAKEIAGGNLSAKIKMQAKDETGQLAKALNEMKASFVTIIGDVTDVATSLAAASEQINASARSLADGAQNQSANVEQTSAAMEEFTATSQQIGKNIDDVNNQSQQAMTMANDSLPKITQAMESMEKISESSKQISEIVKVINDIADQTNLLSLNASIEAARAGEHGRGFAVVAEEISKLADRSGSSTKEIEQLIKTSNKNIQDGVNLVDTATSSFKNIVKGVEKTAEHVKDITTATQQQETGINQVIESMSHISSITEAVAAGAEEMSASTSELQSQAESLNKLIGQFQLDSDDGLDLIPT